MKRKAGHEATYLFTDKISIYFVSFSQGELAAMVRIYSPDKIERIR